MTIQEAIKSNKRFRRRGRTLFHQVLDEEDLRNPIAYERIDFRDLTWLDFLADDWEIKDDPPS